MASSMDVQLRKRLAQEGVSLALTSDPATHFRIRQVEPSPCATACPAGVNVKGYVGLIAAGRFREALELIKRDNPLPGICGRVCHHPCEAHCPRGKTHEPIAIRALKRFAADYELKTPKKKLLPLPRTREEKIAIVGSGPAGLTAAHDLVRLGYGATVFEAMSAPGGMLTAAIPSYRLPRDIVQAEIRTIAELGVEIATNTRIGRDLSLDELVEKEGYSAVFIAVGAHVSRRLEIPGEEEGEGVFDCLGFLRRLDAGDRSMADQRVLVLGGGHSAVDCARAAVRLGAEDVRVVYRRSQREMPAGMREVREAESEGVEFTYLASPTQILRRRGKVTGLECVRNRLGEEDASGRRRPVPVEGSEFVVEADVVISAINQEPDLSVAAGGYELSISRWNTFAVDRDSLATSVPGLFAGGDAVTGPKTVVDAIAHGHRAAGSIHCYLRGKELKRDDLASSLSRMEVEIELPSTGKKARRPMPQLPLEERRDSFQEVDLGFTQEMAVEEARRCLRCGPCAECTFCVPTCHHRHEIFSLPPDQFAVPELLVRVANDRKLLPLGQEEAAAVLLWGPDEERGEIAKTGVDVQPLICYVQENFCRGCGTCVEVCEYRAATLEDRGDGILISRIDATLCKGCGACASRCPSGAIVPRYFTDQWMKDQLKAAQAQIVVFSCSWNPGAAGELLERYAHQDSTPIRPITVPCAGRIHPSFILQAFELGAFGVVLLRCPPDRCHYGFGSRVAEENLATARRLIHLLGIAPWRLQQQCLGGGENARFLEDFRAVVGEIEQGGTRSE